MRATFLLVLGCLFAGSWTANANEFRDEYDELQLDCSSAPTWLKRDQAIRDQDLMALLDTALECTEDGHRHTATQLLQRANRLELPAIAEWAALAETRRARTLLALDQQQEAAALAMAAGTRLLKARAQLWDKRRADQTMYELSELHETLATQLSADAHQAAKHQAQAKLLSDAMYKRLPSKDLAKVKEFRDPYGQLVFSTCDAAQRWLAIKPASIRPTDKTNLYSAGRSCALADKDASARELLALAENIPTSAKVTLFYPLSNRAGVELALEDWTAADATLRAAAASFLTALEPSSKDAEASGVFAPGLSSKHAELARALSQSDPAGAIEHYLMAARVNEAGGFGETDLSRLHALSLAREHGLLDQALAICTAILERKSDQPPMPAKLYTMAIGGTLGALLEADRSVEALALAHMLRASGWPDVEFIADPLIKHAERDR